MTLADLPPSSSASGLSVSAAAAITSRAVAVPAGERHLVDAGVAHERLAGDRAAGHDVQHAGRQARLERELGEASAPNGAISGGLATTVLPAASAGATFWPMPIIGPFHGTIAPTTPYGSGRT